MNEVICSTGIAYIQARPRRDGKPSFMVCAILDDERLIKEGFDVTMLVGAEVMINSMKAVQFDWQKGTGISQPPSPEDWFKSPSEYLGSGWKKKEK